MKKHVSAIATLALVFGLSGSASAADPVSYAELAGITPDNVLLYPVDKALESAQLLFTTDLEDQAELNSELAVERLGESEVMQEEGQDELAQEALEEYNELMAESLDAIEEANEAAVAEEDTEKTMVEKLAGIHAKILQRQEQSLAVLAKLQEGNASENAKTVMAMVMEMQQAKLQSRLTLAPFKQAMIDAAAALEAAEASGTGIEEAKQAFTDAKAAFMDTKASAKTSVGKLKKQAAEAAAVTEETQPAVTEQVTEEEQTATDETLTTQQVQNDNEKTNNGKAKGKNSKN